MPSRNLVFVFDIAGADPTRLDDADGVRDVIARIVSAADLTPVGEAAHRFQPQGLSIAVLLAESHLAVHTWPEDGTAYLTLTTCRPPASAEFEAETGALLAEAFAARQITVRKLS